MKILIYQENNRGGHTDIFRTLDYGTLYTDVRNCCNSIWTNSGNKIWLQGIVSELSTNDNEIHFLESNYTWDFINEYFDAIVYSTANLFQKSYQEAIGRRTNAFNNSKIPVFVISCGAQGELNESPREVVAGIEYTIASFLDSIYSSGGELGLRGYFTKEALDYVGPNTARVIGCPSLFQNGKDLHITNEKVEPETFCAAINGDLFSEKKLVSGNNYFIDQGTYAEELYDAGLYELSNADFVNHCLKKFELEKTELILKKRIRLFMDVSEWMCFLKRKNICFSFGSRIHGNIISILGGIPSLIFPIDSRTLEMTAFYNLPVSKIRPNNITELYEMYLQTDYSEFNKKYKNLYNDFNKFLTDCGLVKNGINEDNIFWKKEMPSNCKKIIDRSKEIEDYFFSNYRKIWIKDKIWKLRKQLMV
jgi:hypothetical protein